MAYLNVVPPPQSKAKKVQQKYKDQDEEERMLRMKILAVRGKERDEVEMKGWWRWVG